MSNEILQDFGTEMSFSRHFRNCLNNNVFPPFMVKFLKDRDWRAEGDQRISDLKKQFKYISTNEARSVILFVADGNGVSTNYGTRLFQGQKHGGYGDEFVLAHEK